MMRPARCLPRVCIDLAVSIYRRRIARFGMDVMMTTTMRVEKYNDAHRMEEVDCQATLCSHSHLGRCGSLNGWSPPNQRTQLRCLTCAGNLGTAHSGNLSECESFSHWLDTTTAPVRSHFEYWRTCSNSPQTETNSSIYGSF